MRLREYTVFICFVRPPVFRRNHVHAVTSLPLEGSSSYLVQIIIAKRMCVVYNNSWPWPISPRQYAYVFTKTTTNSRPCNNTPFFGGVLFVLGTDIHHQEKACLKQQLLTFTYIFRIICSLLCNTMEERGVLRTRAFKFVISRFIWYP